MFFRILRVFGDFPKKDQIVTTWYRIDPAPTSHSTKSTVQHLPKHRICPLQQLTQATPASGPNGLILKKSCVQKP